MSTTTSTTSIVRRGDVSDNEFTVTVDAGTAAFLYGERGNDVLVVLGATDRSNYLEGGVGNDYLQAPDLTDPSQRNKLDGGQGTDTMVGGSGEDHFYVNQLRDLVQDSTAGDDDYVHPVDVSSYVLPENVEHLQVIYDKGTALNARGNALDNKMSSGGGNDVLSGMAGNDTLYGSDGDDTLIGGLGADLLETYMTEFYATTFQYNRAFESCRTFGVDRIYDLDSFDRIDLSRIDANTATPGTNDAFTFIGSEAFGSDATGQVRYEQLDATRTMILVSTDSDRAAEMRIVLVSSLTPTEAIFLL